MVFSSTIFLFVFLPVVLVIYYNPFYVALYVSLFPQLIAGPIVRYEKIEKEIR